MIVSIIFTVVFIISLVSFILYKGIPELSFDLLFSVPSYISEIIGILPDI
jgi:phosphate transport system permease protein